MIELPLVELADHDVTLSVVWQTTKGNRTAASPPRLIEGRVTLGAPAVIALSATLAKGDHITKDFQRQLTDSQFFLMQLACTFHHNDSAPFSEAWLHVRLRPESSKRTTGAIAWSMRPERTEDIQEVTDDVSLSAKFEVMSIGQKFQAGSKVKTSVRRVQVAAHGLLESAPYWHFRRTDASNLEGAVRLGMVVKAARDAKVSARIDLHAKLIHHLLGLIPYRASVYTDPKGLQFPEPQLA
jgi:hypothetical protein